MDKQESQKQFSIIIDGIRYDAVEASKKGCVCRQCDLEELCDCNLPYGIIDLCSIFVGNLRCFKKSDKKFEV